eukprot:PhM_4_TR16800/c1_g2_i5/m.51816
MVPSPVAYQRPATRAYEIAPVQGAGAPPAPEAEGSKGFLERDCPIPDWALDVILRATVDALGADVAVVYPEALRKFLRENRTADIQRVLTKAAVVFAPVLVHGNHWVLVVFDKDETRVYDSFPTHTKNAARDFVHDLSEAVPGIRCPEVSEQKWFRQGASEQVCGLRVMEAAAFDLLRDEATLADVRDLFTREWLATVLPRSAKPQNLPTITKKVGQRLRDYQLRESRSSVRAEVTAAVEAGEAMFREMLADAAPTTTKSEGLPEAQGTQQPSASVCIMESCNAVIAASTKGVICRRCGKKACSKHVSTKALRERWHCPVCREQIKQVAGAPRPPQDSSSFAMHESPSADEPPPPEAGPPIEPTSGFHNGQGSPCLAFDKTGAYLTRIQQHRIRSLNEIHPYAREGIAAGTRAEHLRILNLLSCMPRSRHHWPLERAVLQTLEVMRGKHNWSWSTMLNKTGMTAGALRRLPQYTNGKMPPIILTHSEEWKDATRKIVRLAKAHASTGLAGLTRTDADTAIRTAPNALIKALIMITWACAARAGDVSQLRTDHLAFHENIGSTTQIEVHFARGKVIGVIDPYTIYTKLPKDMADWLRTWHSSITTPFLFQQPSKRAREQLLTSVRL